jgi:hypothetical protein
MPAISDSANSSGRSRASNTRRTRDAGSRSTSKMFWSPRPDFSRAAASSCITDQLLCATIVLNVPLGRKNLNGRSASSWPTDVRDGADICHGPRSRRARRDMSLPGWSARAPRSPAAGRAAAAPHRAAARHFGGGGGTDVGGARRRLGALRILVGRAQPHLVPRIEPAAAVLAMAVKDERSAVRIVDHKLLVGRWHCPASSPSSLASSLVAGYARRRSPRWHQGLVRLVALAAGPAADGVLAGDLDGASGGSGGGTSWRRA